MNYSMRDYVLGCTIGVFGAYLFADNHRQIRHDMKLFYIEAPECRFNWVVPRGDL